MRVGEPFQTREICESQARGWNRCHEALMLKRDEKFHQRRNFNSEQLRNKPGCQRVADGLVLFQKRLILLHLI